MRSAWLSKEFEAWEKAVAYSHVDRQQWDTLPEVMM